MAEIPSANVTVVDEAVAGAAGTGYLAVFSPVATNADSTPRVFASSRSLLSQHGYSPGASYVASHISETRKPVIFCGLPIVTQGAVGRVNDDGVTGSSVITVAAGGSGALEETQGVLRVTRGGTIGTDQIAFALSLDGGETEKKVRLGTASSYEIPYVGLTISFAAGTLAVDDEFTFATTGPRWDAAGLTAARTALAAQQKLVRSFLIVGDLEDSEDADDVVTEVNAYETENQRFAYARAQVRDRLPHAEMSRSTVRMTGTPNITFAEVGGTGDTITRSAGSFITDGFAIGMVVTVSGAVAGSGHNNITGKITNVTALVLTLDTADLDAEGPISGVAIIGSHGLIFTTTTATRSGGSWLDDGFAVGDSATFAGTVSNNITVTITVLTATVMTFASGGAAETIGTRSVTCTTGETKAAWVAAMDAEFASVDDEPRVDLGLGRRRKKCPITGWRFRRPVQWAASLREYQHDLHIATWWKALGSVSGWDSEDTEEFDELVDGGGLAGRFTCFRSWANGPEGAFIAMSLTRADEDSLLSYTHNLAVTNLACTTVQSSTENAVGESLVLNPNGTASQESLGLIEGRVNKAIQIALLQDNGEGQRASSAVWTASRSDILNVPNARLHGVLALNLRGTLVHVDTSVVVQTGG